MSRRVFRGLGHARAARLALLLAQVQVRVLLHEVAEDLGLGHEVREAFFCAGRRSRRRRCRASLSLASLSFCVRLASAISGSTCDGTRLMTGATGAFVAFAGVAMPVVSGTNSPRRRRPAPRSGRTRTPSISTSLSSDWRPVGSGGGGAFKRRRRRRRFHGAVALLYHRARRRVSAAAARSEAVLHSVFSPHSLR